MYLFVNHLLYTLYIIFKFLLVFELPSRAPYKFLKYMHSKSGKIFEKIAYYVNYVNTVNFKEIKNK